MEEEREGLTEAIRLLIEADELVPEAYLGMKEHLAWLIEEAQGCMEALTEKEQADGWYGE